LGAWRTGYSRPEGTQRTRGTSRREWVGVIWCSLHNRPLIVSPFPARQADPALRERPASRERRASAPSTVPSTVGCSSRTGHAVAVKGIGWGRGVNGDRKVPTPSPTTTMTRSLFRLLVVFVSPCSSLLLLLFPTKVMPVPSNVCLYGVK
jgi:hypothetical protein